jgi:hypothetical protein
LALLGLAPEAPFGLSFDPAVLADDFCLAPSYDQNDCTAGAPRAPIDKRPTASAALLPWEMDEPEPEPLLAFDKAVLEASVEVTFGCAPGGCPPGATAGTD